MFYNLADAPLDLMAKVDFKDRQLLAAEARAVLARAERAYTWVGDVIMVANVPVRVEKLGDHYPS